MADFKQDLRGKAAIGKLAAHGADVVVNYVFSAPGAEKLAKQIRDEHGVRAITVQADVSNDQDVARQFVETKKQLGRIDIVMSNAGIEHFGDLDKVTGAEIDKVFSVNVKGQFFVAQQAGQHMETGGRLILMSSISSIMGVPRHAIYAASKAAVTGLVKCLAWDLGPKNITVNCIAAGGVKSDMYYENSRKYIKGGDALGWDEIDARIAAWSPLGRVGMPDDVAGAVALLAGEEAGWITGQTLHVSGGAHMGTA
ncbi:hypothetical protein NEMBOFW57_006803 [Staphylotrichum longicolle]|uniref:Uncharacterized protein n=1 Tax=Staphylotrichum longicolle TaxID=669026 RepID=A0AAD4HYE5_9PEZI|nr:hypothetical protein NEMBOFW57_006803 [Staphylotrichum longicolle]